MKPTFLFAIAIFVLFSSCNQRQESDIKEIEISYKMADGKIEDLIKSYELIQLDTCLEAHFTYATKIVYQDNMYFIKDENKVLIFGDNGEFLNSIERKGRGPDEYVYLEDFYYDKAKKEIVLVAQGNLLIFDINGELIRKEKPGFRFDNILITQDRNYAFGRTFPTGNLTNDYNLLYANEKFELINKKTRLPIRNEGGGMMLGQSNRANSNFRRDYYFSLYCDTVYQLKGENIVPELVFRYDKDIFSITGGGQELDRDNNYLHFAYAEIEKYRLLRFSFNWVQYLAIINKASLETMVFECGYDFDITNLDGNTFLVNLFPQFIENFPEIYAAEKCTNTDMFERLTNNPKAIDNIIVRVELDL